MHEIGLLSNPVVAPFFQSLAGQPHNYTLSAFFVLYGLSLFFVAAVILFTKKQGDAELIKDFDWFAAFAILLGTAALSTAAAILVFLSTGTKSAELEKIHFILQAGAYLALFEFALRLSFNRKEKIFGQFQIPVSGDYFEMGLSHGLKVVAMVGSIALVIGLFAANYSLADIETILGQTIGFFAAAGAALGVIRFALTITQYFGTELIVRYSWLMAIAFAYFAVFRWVSEPVFGVPAQVFLLVFSFLSAHASVRLVRVLSFAPGRPVAPLAAEKASAGQEGNSKKAPKKG